MKLLYLAAIRLPTEKAHGLQIMKTCEAFAAAGAEVELMVPIRRNALTQDPFAYYDVKPEFKITKKASGDFIQYGPLGFFLSLLSFSEAAHLTREFWDADVIYSRDAFVLLQYIFLGRSLVYEAHTAPTLISKFVARRAKRVVVISNGLRIAYEKAGVKKERIIVAPDAIDLAAFAPERASVESKDVARTRLGLPLEKKIVMYIGRLDGWKGVETLCEAAAFLPEDTIIGIIGGEPAQIESFKKKYAQEIKSQKLLFLGYHAYKDLPNNQQAADVLVLPNTAKDLNSSRYTSPLKLFTYMASLRPIVASDLPSIREVLSDETAFFFTPDDAHSLAEKITEALVHPEIATSTSLKAAEVVKQYTWQSRAHSILNSIKTI
jgi:glycosyltransferase involved in cell wall biosynthesis